MLSQEEAAQAAKQPTRSHQHEAYPQQGNRSKTRDEDEDWHEGQSEGHHGGYRGGHCWGQGTVGQEAASGHRGASPTGRHVAAEMPPRVVHRDGRVHAAAAVVRVVAAAAAAGDFPAVVGGVVSVAAGGGVRDGQELMWLMERMD